MELGIFEIIGGIVMILVCIVIILAVVMQETKSNGMNAVSGAESMAYEKGRAKTKDMLLSKVTKIMAVAFFVITLAVCIVSVYVK